MPGELLDPEDNIHPVLSVTFTGSIPGELLGDSKTDYWVDDIFWV
jgi:hypothetical protein